MDMCLWKTKVPLKIKIFLWRVINDKIQSAEQLKKRNWPGPGDCKLCDMFFFFDNNCVTCLSPPNIFSLCVLWLAFAGV
jgi:hypothetical protein